MVLAELSDPIYDLALMLAHRSGIFLFVQHVLEGLFGGQDSADDLLDGGICFDRNVERPVGMTAGAGDGVLLMLIEDADVSVCSMDMCHSVHRIILSTTESGSSVR